MSVAALADAPPPIDAQARTVLSADGIRMQFGGVVALDDVTVSVGSDELFAVIGPNAPARPRS